MRRAGMGALALIATLAVPQVAEAIEVKDSAVVDASYAAVWGRLMRLGHRDSLATEQERLGLRETIELVHADRESGLIEVTVKFTHKYRFRLHLADESDFDVDSSHKHVRPRPCVHLVVLGQGRFAGTVGHYLALILEAAKTPLQAPGRQ